MPPCSPHRGCQTPGLCLQAHKSSSGWQAEAVGQGSVSGQTLLSLVVLGSVHGWWAGERGYNTKKPDGRQEGLSKSTAERWHRM